MWRKPPGLGRRASTVAVVLSLVAAPLLADAPGVEKDRVLFGQTAALGGPASELGQELRLGIRAAFNEANDSGGINGRMLELTSYDDGYEPERAIANTRKLLEDDKVFALIGSVGTPTTLALLPVAAEAGAPVIGPLTGAAPLRAAEQSHVVNLRAGYDEEAEAWVEWLTRDRGISRIAILYQDDSFGRAGRDGIEAALARRGMSPVAEGTYRRNTTAVKRAALGIRKSEPEAVAMICPYAPCAAFVRTARAIDLDAVFFTISFAGAHAVAVELGRDAEGVLMSQVTPFPDDPDSVLAARYRAALRALDPAADPGFVSFEGYLAGRLAVEALRRAGEAPTRNGLLDAIFTAGPIDLDGLELRFGPGDNQGLDEVWLSRLGGTGHIEPVGHAPDGEVD